MEYKLKECFSRFINDPKVTEFFRNLDINEEHEKEGTKVTFYYKDGKYFVKEVGKEEYYEVQY